MGLPIADNVYVEDAAREAERLKRWEFMFTLHIYQIQGGTASPFNGLALSDPRQFEPSGTWIK